jgi:phage antirepressor YoqD-like protein
MTTKLNTIKSFDISIFEIEGGKINLTRMARHFGKEVKDWTRLEQSKNFINALSDFYAEEQIMCIQKGGNGEQGTFAIKEVALKLAQWISPEFEVFCIQKLDELFQKGSVSLTPALPNFSDEIEAAKAWIEAKEKERLALQQVQELTVQVEQAQPAIEFTDSVHNSDDCITIRDMSKLLGIGEKKFFALLRQHNYLFSDNNIKNQPYQKYINNDYFKLIEKIRKDKNGRDIIYFQTMITGKGQFALNKKFKQQPINYK